MRSLFRRRPGAVPALLLCVVAGLAQAASIANPWNGLPLWWLQLLSLGGLVWLLERADTPRQAALRGWLFASAWLTGTFWWLFISMHTYGGLPAPLTVLAVGGLAMALALIYALACGVFKALAPVHPALRAIVFASSWMLAELARGQWFTGFPWGAGGYAQLDGLALFARYVGVYGVGWIAALVAACVVLRQWLPLLAVGLLAGAALAVRLPPSDPAAVLPVTLLQGNIPQDEKFEMGAGVPVALNWYGEQLAQARTPLVVAPETAIPMLPQQLPAGYWPGLLQRFASGGQTALVGVPLGNARDGYLNAVVGLQPGSPKPYEYAKHHLVPFGEFIPPLFKWFTEMMKIPLGDFNRGAVGQPSLAVAGQRLAPNICYEDLFGEELGARFIDPAQAPTIFVNVSNIGWFGNSLAIDQHLSISRMRTLEFERPMLRATNTGATAIIDYRGQVTQALPRLTRDVLVGEVEGRGLNAASGWRITPYAWWVARGGLWPLWGLGLLVWLLAWRTRR
ncbi:apolipoprotein N-acyltransferase [Rhodoferax ferrireducens]|uniref:Apolipoprotein N-acyltransferase n=1 Tax=Rhodoferax ferrireducens TaxID=192843 RepID=A0ABU2CFG5_9BURK|nr:apolipoprotein N-acyltransferase [Rhodoferax ferrireducens]MDR7380073.1 apolipoprotein N-acyltransferase [Rhodoferax ferrireducens]